jgi:hypothetical protein
MTRALLPLSDALLLLAYSSSLRCRPTIIRISDHIRYPMIMWLCGPLVNVTEGRDHAAMHALPVRPPCYLLCRTSSTVHSLLSVSCLPTRPERSSFATCTKPSLRSSDTRSCVPLESSAPTRTLPLSCRITWGVMLLALIFLFCASCNHRKACSASAYGYFCFFVPPGNPTIGCPILEKKQYYSGIRQAAGYLEGIGICSWFKFVLYLLLLGWKD